MKELQEKYLEELPKDLHNRNLGLALETNMDILRELCKASHTSPSQAYIIENLCRMCSNLQRLGYNKTPQCDPTTGEPIINEKEITLEQLEKLATILVGDREEKVRRVKKLVKRYLEE